MDARLADARSYWLATTAAHGRTHVTPVWGVWVNGRLYFSGIPTTRWARNLAAQPRVSLHLESAREVVIVDGRVDDVVTDAVLGEEIVSAWDRKYGRLHPDPAGDGVLRLRPSSVRAWSDEDLHDGTGWDFGDD